MKWLPWRTKKNPPPDSAPPPPRTNFPSSPSQAANTSPNATDKSAPKAATTLLADALLSPAYRGDVEMVADILSSNMKGACLHASDALGNSPLHLASFNGHIEVVRLLLQHGADPHRQNGELDTPVYMAVLANSMECVMALTERKVKFNCQNVEGFTPLHYAAGEGFLDITKFLVEKCGADPEIPDNLGLTPGFCAVLQGRTDVADYLLKTSPQGVHARNISSDTMLHCALKATHCDPKMLKILIHHGSDLDSIGADGVTSEQMLAARGYDELIAYGKALRSGKDDRAGRDDSSRERSQGAAAAGGQGDAGGGAGRAAGGGAGAGNSQAPTAGSAVAQPKHLPFLRKYMSNYIELGSEVPAKPTFRDDVLQSEWEFVVKNPPVRA